MLQGNMNAFSIDVVWHESSKVERETPSFAIDTTCSKARSLRLKTCGGEHRGDNSAVFSL